MDKTPYRFTFRYVDEYGSEHVEHVHTYERRVAWQVLFAQLAVNGVNVAHATLVRIEAIENQWSIKND